MKKPLVSLGLAALLVVPASAMAKGGDRSMAPKRKTPRTSQQKTDPASRLGTVEEALARSPGDLPLLMERQDLLLSMGRRSEVLRASREAFKADPEDASACFLYARLLGAKPAMALLRKVIELDPEMAPAYEALAHHLEDARKFDDAASAMAGALKVAPTARGWNYLGWLKERSGDVEEALDAYASATRLDSAFTLAWENQALLLAEIGRSADALTAAARVVKIAPEESSSWIVSGLVYARLNRYDSAAEAYEKALRVAPDDRTALLGLARAYRRLRRFDLAGKSLARAVELEPRNGSIVLQQALLENDRGNTPLAEEYLRRAARLLPQDPRPHYLLGTIAGRDGRGDQALRSLKKAAALGRDEGRYHLALGYAYERQRQFSHALRSFKKAAATLPGDPRPQLSIGGVHQANGRARDAREAYEAALEIDQDHVNAHLLLGILLADALQDSATAVVHFEKYLELGGHPSAIAAWYEVEPEAGDDDDDVDDDDVDEDS